MNWADYIILAVLALSVLVGLWRGLVSEVLALVVWVAAFWAAWSFGPAVAAQLDDAIALPSARVLVGYGLCFVVVLILGALLRFVMARLVQGTGLSGSDRLLGMFFGLARGALLVTLAVLVLGFTPFTRDSWWQQSQLLPSFQGASGWLAQRLPEAVRRYVHPPAMLQVLPAGLPLPGMNPAPAATISVIPAMPVAASAEPAPTQ